MANTPPGAADFIDLVESKGRRVYVTKEMIDLSHLDKPNEIYVLELPDRSTAAGGRGGGFGERRVIKATHFRCGEGEVLEADEVEDEERLESLDLPLHATAFPITMPDGREKLVTGVADKELVRSYEEILGEA